jgi:hypothetical protein
MVGTLNATSLHLFTPGKQRSCIFSDNNSVFAFNQINLPGNKNEKIF